jgi:CMP-N-acetylneuraminic acid synthetase/spore coat polysaccharide biosynthesis predicted glycosyltransferase SpsG
MGRLPCRRGRAVTPILGIVPARGGSKGVPRKNLRRLGDRPLIAYTLEAAAASGVVDRLVLSSEDDEILTWASWCGYEVVPRPANLADDVATIADVAAHVAEELDWRGTVAVFQPTSPLRSSASIRAAVERFAASDAESLMSCVRERHLFWYDETGDVLAARPLFAARMNRQYGDHRILRETGAIQLIVADLLRKTRSMVTDRHLLFELPDDEALDIDTVDDLLAAQRRLEEGTVVLRLRANTIVGSGHLFHCLQLAEELVEQRVRFLLVDCDPFVAEHLEERGFPHRVETDLGADLAALKGPGRSLVVNDVLDTTEAEVLLERSLGFAVVNIEDLGPGARLADLVVNALYPLDSSVPNVVTGSRWATLRPEFQRLPEKELKEQPTRVLITFGGTDPAGLGPRFAKALSEQLDGVEIVVIVGLGASDAEYPPSCTVRRRTRSMAAEMLDADLVLTAAGRTVFEAAATGTPVVVVAQNAREATHAHLRFDSGVVFLGIGPLVDDDHVCSVIGRLLADQPLRLELSQRLRQSIDLRGTERLADRIRTLLKGLA